MGNSGCPQYPRPALVADLRARAFPHAGNVAADLEPQVHLRCTCGACPRARRASTVHRACVPECRKCGCRPGAAAPPLLSVHAARVHGHAKTSTMHQRIGGASGHTLCKECPCGPGVETTWPDSSLRGRSRQWLIAVAARPAQSHASIEMSAVRVRLTEESRCPPQPTCFACAGNGGRTTLPPTPLASQCWY